MTPSLSSSLMTSLALVSAIITIITISNVHCIPNQIVRRQAPIDDHDHADLPFSHLSDDMLIKCLTQGMYHGLQVPDVQEPTGCQCVKRWQCDDGSSTAGGGSTDNLLTLVNVRTSCIDPFDICCLNVNLNAPLPPIEPPHVATHGPPQCGRLNLQGVDAILVGFDDHQAQFGQFPWMAAVMTDAIAGVGGENVYVCGASLIHPRVVLTAAHYMDKYVNNAHDLVVRLGEWNFKLPSEPIQHQDIHVERIVLHPNFLQNTLRYDVALLFLENNAILGPTINTICLPDPFETFDGASCYSSGWGKDIFGKQGKYQQILKSIDLPAVSHQECQNAYRTTRLGAFFNLHFSFMCAGGQGADTCTGDGGSPLVCPMRSDPSRYVQAGVVAWGLGCGTVGLPGVYASVSEAVPWIGQELLTNMDFEPDIISNVNIRTG